MRRLKLARLLTFALLLLVWSSIAFAVRVERLIDSWRPSHYDVNLTFDRDLKEITAAQARVDIVALKPLSAIDFDFGELTTDRVTINETPVSYSHKNGKLIVQLPGPVSANTKLTVVIDYHGKPKDGLILSNDKDGKPSAIGDNWPDRVHHWIPCFDHPSAKATVTFHITTGSNNRVIANGRFDRVDTSFSGARTWTFTQAQPIPPYCMVVGVGEFAKIEGKAATTFLSYYVAQSDALNAPKGFAPAAPALHFFNQTFGPYPYDKLALIIGATRFGGMENSSAIVFPNNFFAPRPAEDTSKLFAIPSSMRDVVAHEIAHQWFGDSVTESTWADLWLSEGFATYFAGVFIQRYEGEEAFQKYMITNAQKLFAYEKKKRTPLVDKDTENLFELLNANNYEKGSWVLHMLRSQLGDEQFFRGIREYYETHKHATATSEDLRLALEKSSGKDLSQFFDRWVYDTGHPEYDVSWNWLKKGRTLRVTLKQVQQGNVFLDPVPLAIVTANERRDITVTPRAKLVTQTVQLTQPPKRIDVDPNNHLLKEVR